MSAKVDLAGLKRGDGKGKLSFLEINVQKIMSESSFIVSDKKEHILLDVSNSPKNGKCLAVGSCYRLLFPKVEDGILRVSDDYSPGRIKFFDAPKPGAAIVKRFTPKKLEKKDLLLLRDVCNVEKNTVVGPLFLKVVFVSRDKKSKYSDYRMVRVKDVSGFAHFITMYGSHGKEVALGETYKFAGFVAQSYRGEGEVIGRMKSCKESSISRVGKEIAEFFAKLPLGDAALKGMVISHEEVSIYDCCGKCKKSNFKGTAQNCIYCGEGFKEGEFRQDFRVTLVVVGDGEEKIVKVGAFSSHFEFELANVTDESVNAEMIKLHMKKVVIDYMNDEKYDTKNLMKLTVLSPFELPVDSD